MSTTYSPAQLADRWGVTASFVTILIRRGSLPAFSIGKLWRVRSEDADAFEKSVEEIRPREPCDVYVFRCGEYVKIGKAADAERRFAQLQFMNPHKLETIAVLTDGDGHSLERELHARFAAYRHRGEWFRIEGDLAEWVAAKCSLGSTNLLDCTEPEHRAQEATTS